MDDQKEVQPNEDAQVRVIPLQQILDKDREVIIDHNGEVYRLRLTRRNKLILCK